MRKIAIRANKSNKKQTIQTKLYFLVHARVNTQTLVRESDATPIELEAVKPGRQPLGVPDPPYSRDDIAGATVTEPGAWRLPLNAAAAADALTVTASFLNTTTTLSSAARVRAVAGTPHSRVAATSTRHRPPRPRHRPPRPRMT